VSPSWLRHDPRDRWVLAAAGLHGVLIGAGLTLAARTGWAGCAGVAAVLAVLMAWGSNTVSHIHLHTPLFHRAAANRAFALYLTVLLGVPQRWWTRYHLRHHALQDPGAGRLGTQGLLELALVFTGPALLALAEPMAAIVWVAALGGGYGLCALQGQGEHAASPDGVDRRGRIYNALWFNDGFHAAHHRAPAAHWTSLPARGHAEDTQSPWPPALRWFPGALTSLGALVPATLDALERIALRSPRLQAFMLRTHERALRALGPSAGLRFATADGAGHSRVLDVVIVGGGMHPRTALLFARLLPHARLWLLDRDPRHLAMAAAVLAAQPRPPDVNLVCATFDPAAPPRCDVLVVPLALRGSRRAIIAHPPAPVVFMHDWLWGRGGHASARVSWLLGKRIALLRADTAPLTSSIGGNVSTVASRPWPWPPLLPLPPCSPASSSTGSAAVTRPRS
jgi:hypothetical protein